MRYQDQRYRRNNETSECAMLIQVFGCFSTIMFIIFSICFTSLDPNVYGLAKGGVSGVVTPTPYRGGLHFTGPFTTYIKYPATQVTMAFGKSFGLAHAYPPVQTRTGADPSDPDSGGQGISISCSFQFEIVPEKLLQVYRTLGFFDKAIVRWHLLAQTAISNTAQSFTPQQFWQDRRLVTAGLLNAVNASLWADGHIIALRLQLLEIDFPEKFEDSITQVQIAEQQKVINEYLQEVETVVQQINVLGAENQATIANITAGGQAKAKTLVARARRDAFNRKQQAKALTYKSLQAKLGLNGKQLGQYFKIKALQAQATKGKLVVGLPHIKGVRPPPRAEL